MINEMRQTFWFSKQQFGRRESNPDYPSACLIDEDIQQTKRRSKKCMLRSELVPRLELPGPQHDGHMNKMRWQTRAIPNHQTKKNHKTHGSFERRESNPEHPLASMKITSNR
ncbi:hypothetical protein K438DRAFT_1778501 [Mycena galopus ATCC 62051]|nr:hypothetical protein K438DRAFT_1778501 [Mycena galopus ATCC 62051]